jgi:hypothetical protein
MAYRQYTHCVQPADYVDPIPRTNNAFQIIGAILDGVLGGWLPDAILGCDYLLGGKLVCLGGDECAIGRITHFEPPSEKSFPANLDNDFSLNILLAPQGLGDFTFQSDNRVDFQKAVNAAQGRLLSQQPGMPIPHEDEVDVDDNDYHFVLHPIDDRFFGYYSIYPDSKYPAYDPSHSPFQVPGSDGPPFATPALHLEAEGDRVCQVCAVLSAMTGGSVGQAICSATFLGIPIGSVVCHIVGLLLTPLLPLLAAALGVAWASARDGNIDDPRVGDGGELHFGDLVVATGRWVYDAGHKGWNEFHPLKIIQRIDEKSYDDGNIDDLRKRWCGLLANVPPFTPPGDNAPDGMTSGQTGTWTNQRQPENQWILHPDLDGCRGSSPNPPPPR